MSAQDWTFEAVDTLFFRESRPMESVGGSQLSSSFPPPARTLIGAIRTAIGQSQGVDWNAYQKAEPGQHPLHALMGTPSDLGPLRFQGPWLSSGGERLYPMPLHLLFKVGEGQALEHTALVPGPAVHCDLGRVRLPTKARALDGAKPLGDDFLTEAGLMAVLKGQPLKRSHWVRAQDLFDPEPRLGIALDAARRTTGDGLLYQTEHIRPRPAARLGLGMTVHGLPHDGLVQTGMGRLGAEGRMAHWRRTPAHVLPTPGGDAQTGLLLLLLTPALFQNGWLPDGFEPDPDENGVMRWRGRLCGVELLLHSAVVGKPRREGGWDMAKHLPRPLVSLVPEGSGYYCTCPETSPQAALAALHGSQIGQDTAWGRGQLAVGYWKPQIAD
jgi:CRISPR-associated protein Cmr3